MKSKKGIIIAVIVVVVLCLAGGIGSVVLSKKALSKSEFEKKATATEIGGKKMTVGDGTYSINSKKKVKSTTIAYGHGDKEINVYFIIAKSQKDAEGMYATNKLDLTNKIEADGNKVTNSKGLNYHFTEGSSADRYFVSSQIGATFVYASVDVASKDDVRSFVKSLGYLK